MNEPVSIVVLNYNGLRFLKICLDSLIRQSYKNFEIIFFDNNSSDGSAQFVRDNYNETGIKIIESSQNLGFAGGNNEAIKHAENDLIILVNNDVKAEENWLENIVNAMKDKNTIASSYIITEGIDPRYYETNGSVSYLMYNVMNIFDNIEDEFYPNGCSVIFRKSEIGEPFDGDYFYYSEDLYLGLRARFGGMKIKFIKNSVIHHIGGGSNKSNSIRTFYQERNRLLNLFSFFSFWFLIRILPIISLVTSIKLIDSVFSPRVSFWGLARAYLWFIFHFTIVLKKRRNINEFKKVNEKEVIKYMTSKLLNHENPLKRIINSVSYYYSRLMGIKPIEYYQKNRTF
jgi:GT2 family glycosyltransferase